MDFSTSEILSLLMSGIALWFTFAERTRKRILLSSSVGFALNQHTKKYEPTLFLRIANTGNTVVTLKDVSLADAEFSSLGFQGPLPIRLEPSDLKEFNQSIYDGDHDDEDYWNKIRTVTATDIHGKTWKIRLSEYELESIKNRKISFKSFNS